MALIKRPTDAFGLKKEFDRLFNSFFGDEDFDLAPATNTWMPSVDISDDKDNYYLTAELPGVDKNNIKITVKDNTLTISGERKEEKEEKDKNFYRREISYGNFIRSFELPDSIDQNKIKANYKDGILKLTIPKKEEAKPKEIEIKVE